MMILTRMVMMTNSTTTITADEIGALLDEVAQSLADLPGRTPQDGQIATTLLTYVVASIHGTPNSRLLLNTLERRGVDRHEAQEVALALHGLALRLGAWLGRDVR